MWVRLVLVSPLAFVGVICPPDGDFFSQPPLQVVKILAIYS